jgi:hypothetical protein
MFLVSGLSFYETGSQVYNVKKLLILGYGNPDREDDGVAGIFSGLSR